MVERVPKSSGIKVRGKCPDGHQFTTTATAGRVTWTGPCPTCQKPMTCRRLPSSEQTTAHVDPAPGDPAAGELVVKKVRYKDAPPDPRPAPQDDDPAAPDGDPDDEQTGAPGAGDDAGEPDHVGGNPAVSETRRPDGADPAADGGTAGDGAPTGTRDRHGRWSRARRRRIYPGVPYGA
jgi:hypothetical protein